VDARDNKDSSPGHLALANGNFNIVEVLIQRGATVTVQDNESSTYFHLALVNGNFNAVELLL
jgi:cytohesin